MLRIAKIRISLQIRPEPDTCQTTQQHPKMPLTPRQSRVLIVAAGLTAAAVAAIVLWIHPPQPVQPQPLSTPKPAPLAAAPVPAPHPGGSPMLQSALDKLLAQTDRQINKQTLEALRAELARMPVKEAVALLRKFLDSKADASTRLGFKLNSSGWLDEAPTLRAFLLDELGRLDPAAAADYSKTILASMDSADEWAVALRNLALGDSTDDGRAFLAQKTADMLQYAPWQQNPSVGFLESFDVPVYLGGTNLVPTLASLVRSQDNSAIAHAAYLAMDRLVINNPATVLQSLENDPTLMQGRESTRADYFARADVRDPAQLAVLQSYLLNPAISQSELQTFAGTFPNANFMISQNLLTQNVTIDHDNLVARDAQSLAVVQQWMTQPQFANLMPELQTISQRLQGFVAQARQGH